MSDEHATKPSELAALLAEIEESAGGPSAMPYPVRASTHYPGCWRVAGHHNCAVAMVERLAALWKGEEE